MRKHALPILALLCGCLLAPYSYAAQDHSFTYINSAGMFEDVYDYFKYSPAYLPTLEKATLWNQLSNVFDASDKLMTGSGVSYLVLGGQFDLMGMGHAGVLADWDSDIEPQSVSDEAGGSGTGFTSSTYVDYLDLNSDGIIDVRAERKGEAEKLHKSFSNDIYVAYGIGGFMGLDAGLALRARWYNVSRTFNPWNGSVSLKETFEEHTYELTTGNETSRETMERSGNLDYGYARYDLIGGARSKSLLPGWDLLANLAFILSPYGNDYDYKYERTVDSDLSTVGNIFTSVTESGIEPDSNYYPGTGVGFLLDLRGDYQLTPKILLISEAGVEMTGRGITDGKQDRESITRSTYMTGGSLYTDDNTTNATDEYEGSVGQSTYNLGVRGIYQGDGWRLGMGLRGSASSTTVEQTTTTSSTQVISFTGRPVLTDNSTATTLSGSKSELTQRYNEASFAIPVGLQIDIFKNLPIYFGAEHVVYIYEDSESSEVTERTPTTTTTVRGDGSTSSGTSEVNNANDAYSNSEIGSSHITHFYYGLTWWPKENIQLDLKNVYRWDDWRDIEFSFTFHF